MDVQILSTHAYKLLCCTYCTNFAKRNWPLQNQSTYSDNLLSIFLLSGLRFWDKIKNLSSKGALEETRTANSLVVLFDGT